MDLRHEQTPPPDSGREAEAGPVDLARLVEPSVLGRLQQDHNRLEETPGGVPGQDFDFAELSPDDYRTDTPEGAAAAAASQAALDYEQAARLEALLTSPAQELRDLGQLVEQSSREEQLLGQLEQQQAESRQELNQTEAAISQAIRELTRLQEAADRQRTQIQNVDSQIRIIGIKGPRLEAQIDQRQARHESLLQPIWKETNRHSPDAINAANQTYRQRLLDGQADSGRQLAA